MKSQGNSIRIAIPHAYQYPIRISHTRTINVHAGTHTCMHTQIPAHTHAQMCKHTHTHLNAGMQTAHVHMHTLAKVNACWSNVSWSYHLNHFRLNRPMLQSINLFMHQLLSVLNTLSMARCLVCDAAQLGPCFYITASSVAQCKYECTSFSIQLYLLYWHDVTMYILPKKTLEIKWFLYDIDLIKITEQQ